MEIGPGLSQLDFIVKYNHIYFFKLEGKKLQSKNSTKAGEKKIKKKTGFS